MILLPRPLQYWALGITIPGSNTLSFPLLGGGERPRGSRIVEVRPLVGAAAHLPPRVSNLDL